MPYGVRKLTWLLALGALFTCGPAPVVRADDLAARASWSPPTPESVKKALDGWLASQKVTPEQRQKIDALWSTDAPVVDQGELLSRTAASIAIIEPAAQQLVDACSQPASGVIVPQFALLSDESTSPFVRNNLRLLYARWLAQNRSYDEAQANLKDLNLDNVVDPATLLFYQGAVSHRLLEKDACLKAVRRLLENKDQLPRRYATLAELMRADIEPLKADSLDEVSRLMDDIQRRLDLYEAGKRVRKREDDVIAKLDKMIDELEKQRPQGPGSGGGQNRSSNPAQDSAPLGGYGPGNVDPKQIGHKDGWGNLPPRERHEALQQISKDLPAHYREVIEEYFRKLAQEQGG